MITEKIECQVCLKTQLDRTSTILVPKRLWNMDIKKIINTKFLCNNCLKNASEYCCISYVWKNFESFCNKLYENTGNSDVISRIEDNYNRLLITICQTFEVSYIWLDRLCLPDNEEEKSSEIMLMGNYYNQAKFCIALFDNVVPDGDDLLSSLGNGKFKRWLITSGGDDFYYYSWAIERFNSTGMCNDSWFERVWTAQEFCRSQNCIAWDGNNTLNLTKLASMFLNVEQNDPVAVKSALNRLPNPFSDTMLLWRDSKFNQIDLMTALNMTQSRKCLLEEDRIYGVLGLLKHPLKFSAIYHIGLEKALFRALKAAIEIGDISFLSAIDDNPHLFPPYLTIIKRSKPIRFTNLGYSTCKLNNNGLSIPIIQQARVINTIFGEEIGKEEKKTDFHLRIYLSILRWVAYLVKIFEKSALQKLSEYFSPTKKEQAQLENWFLKCISCPVDRESINNLCIDMPDIVFFSIGRRLLRDHEWVLLELNHEPNKIYPKFVIANTINVFKESGSCLFLNITINEGSNKMFFLLCKNHRGLWSRMGCGVCNKSEGQYSTSIATLSYS